MAGGGFAEFVALALQLAEQFPHPADVATGGEQDLTKAALAVDQVAATGAEERGVQAEKFAKDRLGGTAAQAVGCVQREFRGRRPWPGCCRCLCGG